MVDYSGYGNEKLVPLGEAGNQDAIDELATRGNTLNGDGTVTRTVKGSMVMPYTFDDRPVQKDDAVQVTNGVITAVTPATS
jgi:hypothetical protein